MSSTVKNLQFLEAQLGQYLHSHEDDGTTLWVTPQGFRMPYKKMRENLEENMKFVETQLTEHLHEHEVVDGSGFNLTSEGTLTRSTAFTPAGPAYGDGFLWDADFDEKVYKVDPDTGTTTLVATVTGAALEFVAYNSGNVYALDGTEMYIIDTSDGSFTQPYDLFSTLGTLLVGGLYHDGTNLWTHDWDANQVYLFDPADGSENDSFTVSQLSGSIAGAFAEIGDNVWIYPGNEIVIIDATTRAHVETIDDPVGSEAGTNGYGMAYDGEFLYFGVQTDDNDYFLFSLPTTRLVTTHQGFRFPYNWEKDGDININMKFLETEISKYLHKHVEGT